MTINEAFEQLTAQPGWYKRCGIESANARSAKRHYKTGGLSGDRVRDLLKAAGYVIEEKVKAPKHST